MAPKTARDSPTKVVEERKGKKGEKTSESDQVTTQIGGKKRKAENQVSKQESKNARRSARGFGAPKADPVKLVNFLLSEKALSLCRPKNEIEDIESRGETISTYSSGTFTPFEELVSALILSRPISHALGLRSIRTLFNEPYNLNTPKAMKTAGKDGIWNALDKARTQHKGKTAEEVFLFADTLGQHLGKDENDVNLQKLRDEAGRDAEKERAALKMHVKGLAKTGIDIFTRRIQSQWDEFFPFADDRALNALKELGLPPDAEELVEFVSKNWDQIEKKGADGTKEQKQQEIVSRLLERALAAHLEGNVDEVKKAVT